MQDISGSINQKKEKLKQISEMKTGVFSALPLAGVSIFIMAWEIFGKYGLVPAMSETIYEFFPSSSSHLCDCCVCHFW